MNPTEIVKESRHATETIVNTVILAGTTTTTIVVDLDGAMNATTGRVEESRRVPRDMDMTGTGIGTEEGTATGTVMGTGTKREAKPVNAAATMTGDAIETTTEDETATTAVLGPLVVRLLHARARPSRSRVHVHGHVPKQLKIRRSQFLPTRACWLQPRRLCSTEMVRRQC